MKRIGMATLNAEIFIEDGEAFVRVFNDRTVSYTTFPLMVREIDEVAAILPDLERYELVRRRLVAPSLQDRI